MMFPVSRILEMRLFTDPKDGDYYKSVSFPELVQHRLNSFHVWRWMLLHPATSSCQVEKDSEIQVIEM